MNDILWVEKYRPQTILDCILPNELKSTFQQFVENEEIPNLLLTGTAGVGKTTVAKAMLEEIGCTYMMINGSEESGIDTLRTKIKNFASTVSMDGKRKYVILDEADYLNPQSTQPALRGFIEEFSRNCGFILTCNFRNRIIEPLHSRCSTVEFRIPNEQKPKLAMNFMKRVQDILEKENVTYNEKVVADVIGKFFPDWRRCLNELQRYSATGLLMLESSSIYQTLVSKSSCHLLKIKTSKVVESGLFIIWTMTLIGFIVGFMIVYLVMYLTALFLTVFSYLGIILISLPLSLTKKLISWLVSQK